MYPLLLDVKRGKRGSSKPLPAKQPLQRSSYKLLAGALRARATELEFSVRTLATRLGKPPTTVHKTLSGQRRLDPIEFLDWCEALELSDPIAVIEGVRRP